MKKGFAVALLRDGTSYLLGTADPARSARAGQQATNPGRRRGILVEKAHFVHEETGFLCSAARGFSSICNLETNCETGIVKITIPWFNGS
jgi:hypothetical protein